MSLSLKEIFDMRFPPSQGDGLSDLEDMSFTKLKLRDDFEFGLHRLGGRWLG